MEEINKENIEEINKENFEENLQDSNLQEGGVININLGDASTTGFTLSSRSTVTLEQLYRKADQYRAEVIDRKVTTLRDSGGNIIKDSSGNNILDRPILLSDLLKLLNPNSDISYFFKAIPLAQYKDLPDPAALNPVTPAPAPARAIFGGTNEQVASDEVINETKNDNEEFPSLYLNESNTSEGGAVRSHKWSSHKKRKSFRIRTKKNKKL